MRFAFSLMVGLAVAPTVSLAQGPEIAPLLKRALSNRKVRYVGVRTVEFRRGPRPMVHTEYVTRDGSRLRIEFPKDSPMSGQVIVEDRHERRHFFPDRNEIHVLPPRRQEAFDRISMLMESKDRFRFAFGSDETVAGLPSKQIVVSDSAGNVLQRIFVERNSGVMLKRVLFDSVGTKVGGFEFSEIDLRPRISHDVFRLVRRGAKVVTPAQLLEELAQREGFRPIVLPATGGIQLEWSNVKQFDGDAVLIQSYTSPKGRLTLFQLRRVVMQDRLSRFSRGRVNFVSWRRDGRTFVLVADRGREDLKRIAEPISGGTAD